MSQTVEQSTVEEHAAPKEAWDAIAADYDQFVTPRKPNLAIEALRLADLRPGDRFLDVAAGSGALSFSAAHLGARITATDWAPAMIERFRNRAREADLNDAEGYVMDCHSLDFADDTFDIAGSQFGVMLVPDQPRALREMVRVTRPGGRVLVIGFNDPRRFEALQCFIGAIKSIVPDFAGLPSDPPPLEFQIADPETFRRRLSDAGLRDVTIDTNHKEQLEVGSGQELWNWCLGSNPIPGMLVANLDDGQKAAVRDRLDEMVTERAGGGKTAVLTADVNIGIGTK